MTLNEFYIELQSLDVNNLGVWPRWAHVAAIVLVVIAIIGGGTYFLIQPQYDDLQRERQREITLRKEFEFKQRKVAALDAYRAQLATMEHDFGAMLRQLPSKAEVDNLLNDVSQARIAASLDQELFEPQAEIPREFYAELPNKIVVTGTYHQMGTFVSGVAALPRIVIIDEVDIRPTGKGSSRLRMSALAKTYRYLDPNEIRTVPAAAKPGGHR